VTSGNLRVLKKHEGEGERHVRRKRAPLISAIAGTGGIEGKRKRRQYRIWGNASLNSQGRRN